MWRKCSNIVTEIFNGYFTSRKPFYQVLRTGNRRGGYTVRTSQGYRGKSHNTGFLFANGFMNSKTKILSPQLTTLHYIYLSI
jgi:hypothetical protein